jgi:precorrin-3B synthase
MTASPPTPRGWCPSLHEPMLSGDGLLLRVKPHAARLTAAKAHLIAQQAAQYGNGAIDLTQRGNLQPRGFSPDGARMFAEAMVAAGLARAEPGVERGRNLLAPPLLGVDAGIAPGAEALVEALAAAMATWPPLPAKFGVVVDGGGLLPLAVERADLHLRCLGAQVEIRLGGGDAVATCRAEDAVGAATLLARHFLALAPARRMHQAVAQHGAAGILAAAGLAPQPDATAPAHPPCAIGKLPGPVLGVGAPFGQIQAAQLAALAALAERQGDGTLRVTPWRALLLPGVEGAGEAAALGMIVSPTDPRLRVLACTGAPGCGAALLETRAAASWLAPRLPGWLPLLHVSGCAKGCAHPGAAPATLVGLPGGLALVRRGRAGDPPVVAGLTLEQTLAVLETS